MADVLSSEANNLQLKKEKNIITYRSSACGLWLSPLLFLAYLQTILRNPSTIQLNYTLTTVLLNGMMLQSFVIYVCLVYKNQIKTVPKLTLKALPTILTSAILNRVVQQEILLSLITAAIVLLIYNLLLMYVLRTMPKCFTFGEATIVVQGTVAFLYNCYLKLPAISETTTPLDQMNVVLQLGMLAVMLIATICHYSDFFHCWLAFYPLLLLIVAALCCIQVGNEMAIAILWKFAFNDIQRVIYVGSYSLILAAAVYAVIVQIQKNEKGSTATRKTFHILTVLVFLPGLILQCSFLYVASVLMFALLIMLELARLIKLYPVREGLDLCVTTFIDEQDAGGVALTPLYLLVGCSLPLWIHNSPCDSADSCGSELLPLLAGVLAIGIGDTFASVVGSKFGRHKWTKDGRKSVEGTVASIAAQALFIYGLQTVDIINFTDNTRLTALCGIAVISNALIEAFTQQVDNLVLPIVTYIILAFK